MPKWITASLTLFAFLFATLTAGRGWAQEEPPPPPPDDEALGQAKQHFESGKAAFQARDFQAAIREFKAAAALRPSPILDYNIGLADEQLGKGKAAARAFRRYLAGKPDAPNRAEVEAKIAALEQQAPPPNQPPEEQMPPEGQPQQAPPQQYQGADPYAGYVAPPPTGGPQYSTTAPKKKSYWWIVFPVLGGVTLIALIAVAYYFAASSATTYYTPALTALPSPSLNSPGIDREAGVLFRF
jgi:hypothetical protein